MVDRGTMLGRCGRVAVALMLAASLTGCGQGGSPAKVATVGVSGRVILADGKPLTSGRVAVVPKGSGGSPAVGEIKPDGRFELTTREPGDGAAPGEYKVRIEPGPTPKAGPSGRARLPYPTKYIDEDSSGLVIVVKGEPTRLDDLRLR